MPIYVFTETGSGAATATVIAVELGVAVLAGPMGGSLVDRWDLRRTVIATNLLHALALLPLLAVSGERIWPLYLVAGTQSLLRQINNPASFALLPRIVPRPQLVQANAVNSLTDSIARLIGSPLGGIAIAVGGLDTVVAIDLATFLAVALAVSLTAPTATKADEPDHGEAVDTGVSAGLRIVRQRTDLKAFISADLLAEIAFAMFPVVFIVFVVEELNGDGSTIGLIRGTAALGGIVASVIVARYATTIRPWLLMAWGLIGLGLVDLSFANATLITRALPLYFIIFALSGLPNITSQTGTNSTLQTLTPPAVLGRVAGLRSTTAATGAILGTLLAGLLVDQLGAIPLFNLQAAIYITAGAVAYLGIARHPEGREPV